IRRGSIYGNIWLSPGLARNPKKRRPGNAQLPAKPRLNLCRKESSSYFSWILRSALRVIEQLNGDLLVKTRSTLGIFIYSLTETRPAAANYDTDGRPNTVKRG